MKTLKRIMQVLGFLLLAIALLYVTMRITGHIVLKDFYDYATRELPIPGLFDGFTPQGLELDEKTNTFIISGYTEKEGRIYFVDMDKNVKWIYVKSTTGDVCKDHFGGVTIYKDYLLLSGGNGASTGRQFIYTFNLLEAYNAKNGEYITAKAESDVYVGTAFINVEDDILYVGEFNHDGHKTYDVQATTNRAWMPEDAKAIMLSYNLNSDGTIGSVPTKAYSIPDDVQGMAFTPDGIAFSESYAINPAQIAIYQIPTSSTSTIKIDGHDIPYYVYNDEVLVKSIKVSPMIEGIVYSNNLLYTLNESSSHKYLFGLLFRGSYIYSYDYMHE